MDKMEDLDMKSVIEKIVLVAKFQGFKTITESNWVKIQEEYVSQKKIYKYEVLKFLIPNTYIVLQQLVFSWNAVLEAQAVLMDLKKISKYFQPNLAQEIYKFCNPSRKFFNDTNDQFVANENGPGRIKQTSSSKSVILYSRHEINRLKTAKHFKLCNVTNKYFCRLWNSNQKI